MATTTPNFGWAVPTSTDLVKDGAVAIETLGDSIDASLVDLKGGTTNQVLAKNSNTDMDFKWVTDTPGMTNPMTTTGDTIYSSSGSTPARLGIGATGQVLTVSGGLPTWATPGSGGGYSPDMFRVSKSGLQSISSGTWTRITGWTENYDIGADFSTPTWTAPVSGYYTFSTVVRTYASSTAAANRQLVAYYVSGSLAVAGAATSNMLDVNLASTVTLYFNATDTLEIYIYNDNSGSNVEPNGTSWFGQFVRTP